MSKYNLTNNLPYETMSMAEYKQFKTDLYNTKTIEELLTVKNKNNFTKSIIVKCPAHNNPLKKINLLDSLLDSTKTVGSIDFEISKYINNVDINKSVLVPGNDIEKRERTIFINHITGLLSNHLLMLLSLPENESYNNKLTQPVKSDDITKVLLFAHGDYSSLYNKPQSTYTDKIKKKLIDNGLNPNIIVYTYDINELALPTFATRESLHIFTEKYSKFDCIAPINCFNRQYSGYKYNSTWEIFVKEKYVTVINDNVIPSGYIITIGAELTGAYSTIFKHYSNHIITEETINENTKLHIIDLKSSVNKGSESEKAREANAKQDAEAEKAKREADNKAKREAEAEKAKKEADNKAKREAEAEKAKKEGDNKAKRDAEAEKAKQEAEAEKAKQEAEADNKAKRDAEAEKAKKEADNKAKRESEQIIESDKISNEDIKKLQASIYTLYNDYDKKMEPHRDFLVADTKYYKPTKLFYKIFERNMPEYLSIIKYIRKSIVYTFKVFDEYLGNYYNKEISYDDLSASYNNIFEDVRCLEIDKTTIDTILEKYKEILSVYLNEIKTNYNILSEPNIDNIDLMLEKIKDDLAKVDIFNKFHDIAVIMNYNPPRANNSVKELSALKTKIEGAQRFHNENDAKYITIKTNIEILKIFQYTYISLTEYIEKCNNLNKNIEKYRNIMDSITIHNNPDKILFIGLN